MILTNALVRTSDAALPLADTVVIEGDRIVFVGTRADWEASGSAAAAASGHEIVDLDGRTVVPGLIDAHAHPGMVAKSLWHVRLPWTENVDEILAFVRDYAVAHPKEEAPFLYFEYYPSTAFGDDEPTRQLLDTAVSDRPVLLQDFSDHEHWLNSRMLELMGVTRDTPDPVPGLEMFVRDADGEPTGVAREQVYRHFLEPMYEAIGWRPPEQVTPERVAEFFGFMTESGVTSLFEAFIDDEQSLASVAELDRRGELNMVYEGALRFINRSDLPEVIDRLKTWQARYGSERVRVRTLKLFYDGTNESGNSAVLSPLEGADAGGAFGQIAFDDRELTECLLIANAADVDAHIHLVGDRAFRSACDAVAAARQRCAGDGTEWRIQVALAHCELVDPADMARPAELGIIVNWTPHWSGGYFGEEARTHLGDERWNRMYRFGEIAAAGTTLTFASDVVTKYELHRGAPLFGMQVAATRVDPEYPLDGERYPGGVRPHPDAVLPVELLLKGYTIDAAKQLRIDDRVGSIEVGKVANLTVLADDPVAVDPAALAALRVDAVLFEGRVVAGALPGRD
ncbi:amidohydrolase [Schumannella soli]|nr:amidohydrolase family protein [Schumannella soli]